MPLEPASIATILERTRCKKEQDTHKEEIIDEIHPNLSLRVPWFS